MSVAYRVRDWDQHFEKAQSRVARKLAWVAVPNKHDGKGFRRLMARKDGMEIFAAWVLILQVASKCDVRGTLMDSDGPLSADDLSHKTGAPRESFEKAFKALCDNGIAWMEQFSAVSPPSADYEHAHGTLIAHYESTMSPLIATRQDITGHNRTGQNTTSVEPEEAILVFPCVGSGPEAWSLTEAKLSEYRESFPGIDVMAECRKARQWCIDNPTKRKTHRGIPAFISSWLGRAQNRGAADRHSQAITSPAHRPGRVQDDSQAAAIARIRAAATDATGGVS